MIGRALLAALAVALPQPRVPLGPREIDAIARLEMLEDQRRFDDTALAALLADAHPEVRRRAAIAVGRIGDRRGVAQLRARALDADSAVAASTVFAVGQLRDSTTVPWLDSLLAAPAAAGVAAEAAAGLGKIRTAAARAALARFLLAAAPNDRARTAAVGDALLAIGRSTTRGDLAPIVRWAHSADEELRWRATWALFRPRDQAAVPTLLALSADRSALVRSWAVRGLTLPQADSAGRRAEAEALLLAAVRDPDRRVRTEAVRALGSYADPAAPSALAAAVRSPDAWISVSAAEGLGRTHSADAVAPLVAATGAGGPCALRATALQALQALQDLARGAALDAAVAITRDSVPYCRSAALQALPALARAAGASLGTTTAAVGARLDDAVPAVRLAAWQASWMLRDAPLDLATRRATRRAELARAKDAARAGAVRAMTAWADTSDVPWLLDQYDRAPTDVAAAVIAALGAVQRRHGAGAAAFVARFPAPNDAGLRRDAERALGDVARRAWPAAAPRALADYRRIVERWVVPDYAGRPRPRAVWVTPRGAIELELYAGDAPLAVDDFVRLTTSGAVVGTEFSRVVPDFVDQQRAVAGGRVLRDEVGRHRLTRGNLSWASAGLDTGVPGYTLGHTPQPHNEGDFTALGRVVRGLDVVDRLELGDIVTAARMGGS